LPESIEQKIEELSLELASVKTQRDKLNSQARSWTKKRNSIHEQTRKLRTEANSLKEKRDALNQKVMELKNLREQAKALRKEKHSQILKLREKIRTLDERSPPRNLRAVQQEIESLEWKIQTTSLAVKEEEKLISRVGRLEIQQKILRQLQESKNILIELQAEETALATKAKSHHQKLSELAEQSQKLHEQRLGILSNIQNFKAEADNAHQEYVKTRKKADAIHQRCLELGQKISSLKQKQRNVEEAKQAKRQKQLLREACKKALEKKKRGEKLTWEEFKLLTEEETNRKRGSAEQKFKEE
jgi:uncharacterized coiled-coil DUF342 family protein